VMSTDNGQNWNPLANFTTAFANTEISAIAPAPSNSLVIYAGRRVHYELSIPGFLFKTTDGGASFVNVTNNLPDSLYYTGIEVDAANSNIAYVSMAGFSLGRKVYMTSNGGTSWTNVSYNLPNIPVNCIKQIPNTKTMIVATDLGVYTLPFGATSWVNNSTGLPNVIISDIEFNIPLNKVYVSTFGRGIWQTSYSILTSLLKQDKVVFNYKLYPSINNGKFTLEFLNNSGTKKIEVIDVMGRVVYSTTSSEDQLEIKLDVMPGAYFAKIMAGNDKLNVKRFIVN
jgi:hypothetical protein